MLTDDCAFSRLGTVEMQCQPRGWPVKQKEEVRAAEYICLNLIQTIACMKEESEGKELLVIQCGNVQMRGSCETFSTRLRHVQD
jgi:hypothetical protein